MNLKFYLRNLTKEKGNLSAGKEQPVWCYITFNNRRVRLSTLIKVFPKDWNESKECIRGSSPTIAKLNHRLKSIRSKIDTIDGEFIYRGEILTEDKLKTELKPILFPDKHKSKNTDNLIDYLVDFIKDNPKNLKISTLKGYKQLVPLLTDFAKKYGRSSLEFEAVNTNWGESFVKFLKIDKNHSINNVDKNVKNIKSLMRHSLRKELHQNLKFEYIAREKEETKEIYLTDDEIKSMYKLAVDEEYQHAKDIFVFSALTGLRISDALSLRPRNWKGDYIEIETIKTEEKLKIPLRKTAKEILNKYTGQLPRIYEQKYNKQLKYIAELLPFMHTEEILYSTKGGKREQYSIFRYQLIKSHTARRSFATNEYLMGTDPLFIRAITGHKTEKDFFNYIKVKQTEKATSMLALFKKRDF